MRTCMTALMLLCCVCIHAQNTRSMSMSYQSVVQQLGTELQNNSQDNEFQRGIRFRVTVHPNNEIEIEQTWLQNNGTQDQMVLSFHPRDIIDVDKKYHKDAIGLAIRCRENTVANYWLNQWYLNNSVYIQCLKDDIEAVARIEKTLLQLRELSTR